MLFSSFSLVCPLLPCPDVDAGDVSCSSILSVDIFVLPSAASIAGVLADVISGAWDGWVASCSLAEAAVEVCVVEVADAEDAGTGAAFVLEVLRDVAFMAASAPSWRTMRF